MSPPKSMPTYFVDQDVCVLRGVFLGNGQCLTHDLPVRRCWWCGEQFHLTDGRQWQKHFCCAQHRHHFHNRMKETRER